MYCECNFFQIALYDCCSQFFFKKNLYNRCEHQRMSTTMVITQQQQQQQEQDQEDPDVEGESAPTQGKKRARIQLKSVSKRDLPLPKYRSKTGSKKHKLSTVRKREERFYVQQQGVIVSRPRVKSNTKIRNEAMRESEFTPLFEMLELEKAPKIQQTKEAIDMDTRCLNDVMHRLMDKTKIVSTNIKTGHCYTSTKQHVEVAAKLVK